jgi:hypothetical protein
MATLSGGAERVDLGAGYVLVAPGLRGSAQRHIPATADLRAVENSTPLLDAVLTRMEMGSIATVEITAAQVPASGLPGVLRDTHGEDALLLEVPDLGPEAGQVVLSVDEAGALSWHFPLDGGHVEPPSVRGAGGKKRFLIRGRVPPTPQPDTARDRALFGAIGRKLLKVIIYPVTDFLLAKPAEFVADYWEKQHRAYGIRDFSPTNYRQPTTKEEDRERLALTAQQLDDLTRGRALLFIHGTFSSAHGAFYDLAPELMSELHQRYEGRVFAFNHFTMSHDPQTNVRWFLEEIRHFSPSAKLAVDVVCHSRGGLVARTLAEGRAAFDMDTRNIDVRRIVFVGVPNQGTLLADPDHVGDMIDRMTTALNVVPPGSPADWLEGLLIGVKVLGHAGLNALVGLHSMNPKGKFFATLNRSGNRDAEYFAIAANYEPIDEGLRSIISRSANALMDTVFEDAENDLVVPERGVYDKNGSECFPIATDRCLRLPASAGVLHTTMFGNADVQRRLSEWLR